MDNSAIFIPAKWKQYLKRLADNQQTDVNSVVSELCAWAFSSPESKKQFEAWLDDAFPPKGEAEDKASAADEEIAEKAEEADDLSEEESHEHRD